MTNRFNITIVTTFKTEDGERKNYTRCGTAFLNQTQAGEDVLNLKFDFMPVPAPGQTMEIVGFRPKDRETNGPDGQ